MRWMEAKRSSPARCRRQSAPSAKNSTRKPLTSRSKTHANGIVFFRHEGGTCKIERGSRSDSYSCSIRFRFDSRKKGFCKRLEGFESDAGDRREILRSRRGYSLDAGHDPGRSQE